MQLKIDGHKFGNKAQNVVVSSDDGHVVMHPDRNRHDANFFFKIFEIRNAFFFNYILNMGKITHHKMYSIFL